MPIEIDISRDNKQPPIKVRNDHPERISEQEKIKQEDISMFVGAVHDNIEDIKTSRKGWEEREVRYYKTRYGIRPKKSFPWPGASNSHIYTIDKTIRKLKPGYVGLAWPAGLLAEFKAPRCEKLTPEQKKVKVSSAHVLDHIIREKMEDSFKRVNLLCDKNLQSGFAIMKITYDFKTIDKTYTIDINKMNKNKRRMLIQSPQLMIPGEADRALTELFTMELDALGYRVFMDDEKDKKMIEDNIKDYQRGKRKLKFNVQEVVRHAPKWTVCDADAVLVNGVFSEVEDAQLICHELELMPNELRKYARSGYLDATVVEELLTKISDGSTSEDMNGNDQGMNDAKSELIGSTHYYTEPSKKIKVREVCLYADPDDSKISTRCMMTYFPDLPDKVAKMVKLPYEDNEWPYVKVRLEITDRGWLHHRGIPAKLDYYSTLINVKHNQSVDGLTLSTAPMFEYVRGNVNMANIRYIPGQGIPVKQVNSIKPFTVNPGNYSGLLEEIRMLKHEAEDYIGTPDFTLSAEGGDGNDSRTATEILTKAEDRKGTFVLDAQVFLDDWQKILAKTWSRHLQYGEDEIEIEVKGEDTPQVWKKANFPKSLKPYPVGSAQETNPILKANQVNMMSQMIHDPIQGPMMKAYNVTNEQIKMIAPARSESFILNEEDYKKETQRKQEQQQQAAKAQMDQEIKFKQMEYDQELKLEALKGKNEIAKEIAKAKLNKGKDVDNKPKIKSKKGGK